jgi:amidase
MFDSRRTIDDTLNAFCRDSDVYLEGATGRPLSGLTFAAKDIFDVVGHVTGGGNPDWRPWWKPGRPWSARPSPTS